MLALILSLAIATEQNEITGRVVKVSDGDTIVLLVDHQQVKIRLLAIDAPEKSQPFGQRAKQHLAAMVHEKDVRVVVSGKDRYGRTLGTVFAGDVNVNEEMIHSGMAWHFNRYDHSPSLAALEIDAHEARRGLWIDADPVAPWVWRATARQSSRRR